MSFGAFGGRKDIMQLFNPTTGPLAHAGTFNNNVLSMAAGLTGLDIYDSLKVETLNGLGKELKEKLQEILIDEGIHGNRLAGPQDILEIDSFSGSRGVLSTGGRIKGLPVMFVAGCGSMLNVRFSGPDTGVWNGLFYHHMLEEGIYLAPRGNMTLSLEITEAHADMYVAAFKAFVVKHRMSLRH